MVNQFCRREQVTQFPDTKSVLMTLHHVRVVSQRSSHAIGLPYWIRTFRAQFDFRFFYFCLFFFSFRLSAHVNCDAREPINLARIVKVDCRCEVSVQRVVLRALFLAFRIFIFSFFHAVTCVGERGRSHEAS